MERIVLVTGNPSKIDQISPFFVGLDVSFQTSLEAGVKGEAVEDGATLLDNALKKALYARQWIGRGVWSISDDTGFFINALGGQPGIRAARWAGEHATTDEITDHTLRMMLGQTDRTAMFETVVALISPEGRHHFFRGQVNGRLLEERRCQPQPRMPYSPIFVPEGSELVFAQMTVAQENEISHRGKAFRQVRKFFEDYLQ